MAPSPQRTYSTIAALLLAVVAFLSLTNPSAAQQTSPPSPLPAPELTAQAAERAVELRWTAVTGAVRYELWAWWNPDTDWLQIGGDDLTGTSYNHTDLTAGETYFYQIRSVGAGGERGDWSEQISAAVPGGLAAPALTAQAGEGVVELRWDAVAGAARYILWSWWDPATGWQQIGGDDLTGTSYNHTDLTAGTTYYYQIEAVGAGGKRGAGSERVSATVTGAQLPTPTASTPAAPTSTATQTTSHYLLRKHRHYLLRKHRHYLLRKHRHYVCYANTGTVCTAIAGTVCYAIANADCHANSDLLQQKHPPRLQRKRQLRLQRRHQDWHCLPPRNQC